ncbi:YycH family regulatory protein [Paenibacillus koleovorans]|uniref:YycH family regulatory protein n=1 Tax=Paenibacillus koleovorans TaxID=121608 RepID=UPI000FDAB3EB|nr:two-component system activity regulator YycH [Paenibacillus koleovorans]
MNGMMEKTKSIVLTLLIFSSLVQSYYLVFGEPRRAPIKENEYVEANTIGTQLSVDEVVFPDQMIIHSGKETHTVLYPNSRFYTLIFESIKKRTFDSFRRTSMMTTGIEWEEIRNKQPGVELRFRGGIPFSILKTMFVLRGDLPLDNEMVTRLWIFTKDVKEDVKTYFQTEFNTYEARADLNNKDVEGFVGFQELQTTYHTKDGDVYLPDKPLEMTQYRIPYEPITIDQLIKTLFVDPRNTRNFDNRDGSQIYTDGKRGLQVKADPLWMSYSDPIPTVDSRNDVRENLSSAVTFVNQHGGWNGQFGVKSIPLTPIIGRQAFTFRQYYDSYPIVSEKAEGFGLIRLVLQRGVVASYDRSMLTLETRGVERSLKMIEGGKALDDLVTALPRRSLVAGVYPAYQPVLDKDEIMQLNPVWVVEYRDGTYEHLK